MRACALVNFHLNITTFASNITKFDLIVLYFTNFYTEILYYLYITSVFKGYLLILQCILYSLQLDPSQSIVTTATNITYNLPCLHVM
jgi:hypothetical protein